MSGGGTQQWITVVDGLAPWRRSAFVQMPVIGPTADARSTILEVEATDNAGHVGRHAITLQVPVLQRPDGNVTFTNVPVDGIVPGEDVLVCYDALGTASANLTAYLVFDTEESSLQRGTSGSPGMGSCTLSTIRTGKVSTNRARYALFADGVGNDNDWYFSEPFEVRPLPDFPDAPPEVTMTSPMAGQRFAGGTTLPVRWIASDDEGLREFRIQASFNDGRCWSTLATVDGVATAYDLELPPLGYALDEVRIRVVAVDRRFQATADGDSFRVGFDPGGAL